MKVAIYNLEPKFKNIALEKVKKYHLALGDEVYEYIEIEDELYDKIYCSSIFTFTPKEDLPIDDRWVCGGTGFDLTIKLPPEIDNIRIQNNVGFTMRGCPNNCKFCVVPRKEGKPCVYADIYDIWDGKKKLITLYDNNILSMPKHFEKVAEQLLKHDLIVDWNQGLDARLLTNDKAKILAQLSHKEYKFAFDSMKLKDLVLDRIELLKKYNIERCTWLVLVGFDTTVEEDFERLNLLRDNNQNVSVMRYRKVTEDMPKSKCQGVEKQRYTRMARWGSQHNIFQGMTYKQFEQQEYGKKIKPVTAITTGDLFKMAL